MRRFLLLSALLLLVLGVGASAIGQAGIRVETSTACCPSRVTVRIPEGGEERTVTVEGRVEEARGVDLDRGPCAGLASRSLDLEALDQQPWREAPFRLAAVDLHWEGEREERVVAVLPPGSRYGARVVVPVP